MTFDAVIAVVTPPPDFETTFDDDDETAAAVATLPKVLTGLRPEPVSSADDLFVGMRDFCCCCCCSRRSEPAPDPFLAGAVGLGFVAGEPLRYSRLLDVDDVT